MRESLIASAACEAEGEYVEDEIETIRASARMRPRRSVLPLQVSAVPPRPQRQPRLKRRGQFRPHGQDVVRGSLQRQCLVVQHVAVDLQVKGGQIAKIDLERLELALAHAANASETCLGVAQVLECFHSDTQRGQY